MSLSRLGVAIIINNISEKRPGSKQDVDALKEAYETVGFEVIVHDNCDINVSNCQCYTVTLAEFFLFIICEYTGVIKIKVLITLSLKFQLF